MFQKTNRLRSVFAVVALLIGGIVFVVVQGLPAPVAAEPSTIAPFSAYRAQARTDALAYALMVAQGYGMLDKPDAIFVKKAVFQEFEEDNESWPIWDKRVVWAVRLDKHFLQKGRNPNTEGILADHVVVFVDEQTGMLAGVRLGTELTAPLQKVDWTQVEETDIGNFPLGSAEMPPEFIVGRSGGNDATATPVPVR